MAKNQRISQNPSRSSCEKMRRGAFGRFRRVDPKLSSKPHFSYPQPMALQEPVLPNEIPIEYVPPPTTDVKSVKNVRFSSKNSMRNDGFSGGKELAEQKTFGDSRFDSFIGRMKMKMSAPSDVGSHKLVKREDSLNEKVSNFIHRAKLKLRATSSMGANGKSVSFK